MKPATVEWVTKAEGDFATAGERFLTGQAYLETAYTALDTPIFIHQGGVMDRPATAAKVVSRFAKL